jgi:hypothetical protein
MPARRLNIPPYIERAQETEEHGPSVTTKTTLCRVSPHVRGLLLAAEGRVGQAGQHGGVGAIPPAPLRDPAPAGVTVTVTVAPHMQMSVKLPDDATLVTVAPHSQVCHRPFQSNCTGHRLDTFIPPRTLLCPPNPGVAAAAAAGAPRCHRGCGAWAPAPSPHARRSMARTSPPPPPPPRGPHHRRRPATRAPRPPPSPPAAAWPAPPPCGAAQAAVCPGVSILNISWQQQG